MNQRRMGGEWEEKASRWLTAQGVGMLEKNYRCLQGEIDLVGIHQGYLVFIEVKYRSNLKTGYPAEAVGIIKQRTICKAADHYRMIHRYGEEQPVRYDVIGIWGEEIRWYQNAFDHIGGR